MDHGPDDAVFQVYNEQIRDLLLPRGTLPIREDPNSGVLVPGLSLHKVSWIHVGIRSFVTTTPLTITGLFLSHFCSFLLSFFLFF